MAVKFIDENGSQQTVELEGIKFHEIALKQGKTFRQVINEHFPTKAGDPDAFSQFCVSSGLKFARDNKVGMIPSTMQEALRPEMANQIGGSYTSSPGTPDSTILFMPALLETVSSQLEKKTAPAVKAFESLIAKEEYVPGVEFKQAVVNWGGDRGPEQSEWKRTTQNSEPDIMLSVTAADVSRRIPTVGIGMEVSDEAQLIIGIDHITDSISRFVSEADFKDWLANILLVLNGDPDGVTSDMDDNTAALTQVKANTLDTNIASDGKLTQKAWLKWLYSGSMFSTTNKIICDFDSALAIDEREGRPTNIQNNSIDRLDVPFQVTYPDMLGTNGAVDMIVMPEGSGFPANTILGLDSNWALRRVSSLFAEYSGVVNMIMRRSSQVRVDRGSLLYRQYTNAFKVLSLTT